MAIKTTGNVYCWEAVEELNVKPKNWKDLLTDEPFTRKDIIHIQVCEGGWAVGWAGGGAGVQRVPKCMCDATVCATVELG